MRLLVVTQDFPPEIGGIQTYTWELVRRWAHRDARLAVLAPDADDPADVDASLPVPVTRVSTRPDLLPVAGAPALLRIARKHRVDVTFHAQWQTVAAALVGRWATGFPRRIVCAAHGRELLFNPARSVPALGAAYDRLRRALLRGVDRFAPVSRYTAGLLHDLGVPPDRTTVVRNGTDPDRFHPIPRPRSRQALGLGDRSIILTVGRIVRRKGLDTVIRALPSIADAVPNVLHLIVGTGPDRDRLTRLAAAHGVRDRVRFEGEVAFDDLPTYYSAADVFAMPSRESRPDVEGFGLVFLEAGACATPVVGARSGGIPDAVRDDETGLLVPPDDPNALADALTRILTSDALARRLGTAGRQYTLHTANWDEAAARLWEVLARTDRADRVSPGSPPNGSGAYSERSGSGSTGASSA
jgi:phosphatidylinositol alpha-1,6-mannosyltransferase